jgi:hypothetical protein
MMNLYNFIQIEFCKILVEFDSNIASIRSAFDAYSLQIDLGGLAATQRLCAICSPGTGQGLRNEGAIQNYTCVRGDLRWLPRGG